MSIRLLSAAVAAAALTVTLAGPSPARVALPEGAAGGAAHGGHAPSTRPLDRHRAHHQVAIARHATRKFHAVSRAKRHDYALFRDQDGIACIAMPHMGAMGLHFVNGDLVGTPEVRLRTPEALVYDRVHGRLRLVALEYLVLRQDWEQARGPDAPRPRLFGHRFDLTPAGNRYGLPAFYSLHAWVWKHNPDGRFTMWNPHVHCGC